jgi:uncharacterized surface protein with fasciclin (FAS1) repeats
MRFRITKFVLGSSRALLFSYLVAGLAITNGAIAGGHSAAKPQSQPDIVDTAVQAGSFTTLVAAIQAAGLVDALKADGPYTVFAPSDEAFARFEQHWPGTLENLLKPENKETLAALLKYHVVPGTVMAADIKGEMRPASLQGSKLLVTTENGVMVDYAHVVSADIETSNGVIHVIDAVIIPAPGS